jgi:hypothetical protein
MRKRGLEKPTSAAITLLALVLATACSRPTEPRENQARQDERGGRDVATEKNLETPSREQTAAAEVVVEKSDATCKRNWQHGEFDVTCLALKPKARVVRIIGAPTRRVLLEDPAPPPFENYPWGDIYYEKGLLKAVTYNYPVSPADYPWGPQALEWIGLKKTSEPHDYGFIVGWGADSRQLVCCGLVMETVVMLKNLAQITVRFNRRTDTPSR